MRLRSSAAKLQGLTGKRQVVWFRVFGWNRWHLDLDSSSNLNEQYQDLQSDLLRSQNEVT